MENSEWKKTYISLILNTENGKLHSTFNSSFYTLHSTFKKMDISGAYRGGTYKKRVDPKEIEKMKKNMKKVPIIELKSDVYHLKEEQEAEKLLAKIHENNNT